jgi:putative DNA primase/helicase
VVDVAERLQVPADFPAAALIVMLAGVLGRRAFIRPHRYDPWLVFPNLWGVTIGRPGAMKSPVLRAILGPLRRRQALAMAVYESEREAYQRQLQAHLAQKRNHRAAVSTREAAEGTGWDGGMPTPPVCTRYLVNEATIEGVHVILKENPQGVLYLRDELSGWLAPLQQRNEARVRTSPWILSSKLCV